MAVTPTHPRENTPMKATWNGTVIAESEHTEVLEGNHYFPAESVKREHLLHSNHTTMCSLKGKATYQSLFVNGDVNPDAAWTYLEPRDGYEHIRGHVAFFKGVQVTD